MSNWEYGGTLDEIVVFTRVFEENVCYCDDSPPWNGYLANNKSSSTVTQKLWTVSLIREQEGGLTCWCLSLACPSLWLLIFSVVTFAVTVQLCNHVCRHTDNCMYCRTRQCVLRGHQCYQLLVQFPCVMFLLTLPGFSPWHLLYICSCNVSSWLKQ